MNKVQDNSPAQGRDQQQRSRHRRVDDKPWYKQFWPWFIIALPLSSVIASFTVLWLAITKPDHEVLNAEQSRQLHQGLKAQPVAPIIPDKSAGQQDSTVN